MKKIIIIVSVSLIIIASALGIMHWTILVPHIDGYLFGYEKSEDSYDPANFTGIGKSTFEDIKKYPEKYTAYWVDMHIENITDHYVYNLNSSLSKAYPNMWFRDSFTAGGNPEFSFNLSEHEVSDWGFYILIKTENMNESEIDKLIRSINIAIRAENTDLPVFASNTIRFKDS